MKSKPWSEKDVEKLREFYAEELSLEEISRILGRSKAGIRNKAYVEKISISKKYTKEELDFIKENYHSMNIRELATELGRGESWQNVCRTARKLGLTGNKKKVRHSDQPIPVIRTNKFSNDEERLKAKSAFMKKWYAENPHPRGMLGKHHNKVYREWRSEYMKKQWQDKNSYFNSEEHSQKTSDRMSKTMSERLRSNKTNVYSRGKGGTRKDLGIYVRSKWEANFARYLNLLVKNKTIYKWEYEPDTYYFENIKRGTRSYTPDFKVWDREDLEPYYYEVKGYMDKKSQTKLKRMAKYYPDIEIRMVQKKEYDEIAKFKSVIKEWEK
ncbi:hypothetical protein P7E43_10625 [Enterococcus gallinarum]|uniref:hypothetical protein n=1 Tax=Enterococcus gallinarum TaxID=1353 RepID=UPI00288FB5C5|nr:hypothetical protein [Enterococcus gallinarum]MDT2697517.1 hypothetical protein [Enterococcus gallinarum]